MNIEPPGTAGRLDLLAAAARQGPIPFSAIGRRERWRGPVAPRTAEWAAEALDRWWYRAGRPDPYPVVDVGAGDGSLGRQVLALGPECLAALRYILVEPDGVDTDLVHARELPVESPSQLFPPEVYAPTELSDPSNPSGPADPSDRPEPFDPADPDEPRAARGIGPLVTTLRELPRLGGPATVLAIGWLERLPVDLVEWRDGRWWEIRLAVRDDRAALKEILVPVGRPAVRGAPLDAWRSAGAADGDRFAVAVGASAWLGEALRCAESGVLAVCGDWTDVTRPLTTGDFSISAGAMGVDQLGRIHHPESTRPEPLPIAGSVVTWRLG